MYYLDLNVMGNWVFYTNHSDKGNIYRINTSGKDKKKLTDERGIEIHVINDWVYYKNSHTFIIQNKKRWDAKAISQINMKANNTVEWNGSVKSFVLLAKILYFK